MSNSNLWMTPGFYFVLLQDRKRSLLDGCGHSVLCKTKISHCFYFKGERTEAVLCFLLSESLFKSQTSKFGHIFTDFRKMTYFFLWLIQTGGQHLSIWTTITKQGNLLKLQTAGCEERRTFPNTSWQRRPSMRTAEEQLQRQLMERDEALIPAGSLRS